MDVEKVQQAWEEQKIGSKDYSEMINLCMALTNTAKVIKSKLAGIHEEVGLVEAAEFGFYMIGEHHREELTKRE